MSGASRNPIPPCIPVLACTVSALIACYVLALQACVVCPHMQACLHTSMFLSHKHALVPPCASTDGGAAAHPARVQGHAGYGRAAAVGERGGAAGDRDARGRPAAGGARVSGAGRLHACGCCACVAVNARCIQLYCDVVCWEAQDGHCSGVMMCWEWTCEWQVPHLGFMGGFWLNGCSHACLRLCFLAALVAPPSCASLPD